MDEIEGEKRESRNGEDERKPLLLQDGKSKSSISNGTGIKMFKLVLGILFLLFISFAVGGYQALRPVLLESGVYNFLCDGNGNGVQNSTSSDHFYPSQHWKKGVLETIPFGFADPFDFLFHLLQFDAKEEKISQTSLSSSKYNKTLDPRSHWIKEYFFENKKYNSSCQAQELRLALMLTATISGGCVSSFISLTFQFQVPI